MLQRENAAAVELIMLLNENKLIVLGELAKVYCYQLIEPTD
jgi:hypothetical protein